MSHYRKAKGLISMRSSQNSKGPNLMSKSLKLGALMKMRNSGKGSDMTKASPTLHERKAKTNNMKKVNPKNKRIRGLLSFQSDEESLVLSQELRKKNALLRSEIIERQKKMGKRKSDALRSVSMILGDDDKQMSRKKLVSNTGKKRSSKKIHGNANKNFIEKKIANLKNQRSNKTGRKVNGVHYKTQTMRRNQMMTMKNSAKGYATSNKNRMVNLRQKNKILKTLPSLSKKMTGGRRSKRSTGNSKSGFSQKKEGKNSYKKSSGNSKKIKENSRRSINNIYKRSQSSKADKLGNMIIYENKDKAVKGNYITEKNRLKTSKDDAERRMRTKGLATNKSNFENIYEKQIQESKDLLVKIFNK